MRDIKYIKHPHGNFRSLILKSVKKILQKFINFCFIFWSGLNDEIIISSATAPWRRDREFLSFFKDIEKLTLLDLPRAYTLWQCSKNVSNINGTILDIGCC